ncbi:hypothetical protein, partial [Isoptericola chiayiensis]
MALLATALPTASAAATDDVRGFGSKAEDQSITVSLSDQQDLLDGGSDGGESDVRYYRATVHYCLLDDLDS